ncbi:MAG: sulfotransferase family protein [Methyloligellaceae bacterium]
MGQGPDFLIIGAARSGTTFLHTHLRTHPDLWLPPKKEIYYFSYQSKRGYLNRRQREHIPAFLASAGRALRMREDAWHDVRWGARYLCGRPSDRWFLSLYPALPDRVIGQVEPSYANLPEATIRHIASLIPGLRIIFMMRDPLDRAWSQVLKRLARQTGRAIGAVPEDAITAELDRYAVDMSSYADILDRWQRAFPETEIFCSFYDALEQDPRGVIDGIAGFLGVGPHPNLDDVALGRRINDTQAYFEEIPAIHVRRLAERLLEPTQRLAARFPDPVDGWARRLETVLTKTQDATERTASCITS